MNKEKMNKEKMNKEKIMQMYDIHTITRMNNEQKMMMMMMMMTKNQETIPLLYYLQVFLQQISHLSPLLHLVVQFLPLEWCHLA